jgi:PAS domain S-box-containing protein
MTTATQTSSFSLRWRPSGTGEFEILLDHLPEALLVVERRSRRILLANTRAAELTGYTRAELAGFEMSRLFSGLEQGKFWDKEAGEIQHWEFRLVKRNRTPVDVRATRTELSSNGKWILVALTEVSFLLEQEAERQRQEEQWNSLQRLALTPQEPNREDALHSAVEAGAALLGADSLYVYLADGKSLELRRSAAWGAGLPDTLPSQDLAHLRSSHLWTPGKRSHSLLHRFARAAGFSFLASAPLGQPNAAVGLVAAGGSLVQPADGLPALIQILAGTITTIIQHHALLANLQAALQEQLRILKLHEATQEAIQDALIVLAPDQRIVRMNGAAEKTLGYDRNEVRGQPAEYVLIGSEGVTRALAGAKQGLATYGQGDSRLYRRSGQAFLAHLSILPVTADGTNLGTVILIRDLTEKEQIKVHAQQLEQRALLGEVTAVFAHEVRNPINNLSTGLQLLVLNLPENDPNQEILTRLQSDCDRLADLMKSVLQFSHPTDYDLEPVDMGVLITRLLDRMRPKIARANIKHFLQVEPGLPFIFGNQRALEQVFTNLVTNALQAMGEPGGTLAVRVQASQAAGRRGLIEVSIADSGPGIPKENLDRIFQPFFTTKSTGTGLGLAITKRIVTAHKGTIRVNSFPGGTVFQVQLPQHETAVDLENDPAQVHIHSK